MSICRSLRTQSRSLSILTELKLHRFGVWGEWEEPYLTLNPKYEAAQVEVFGMMFLNGHIYRGRKPVHWSPSSQTALAEAVRTHPNAAQSSSFQDSKSGRLEVGHW